MKRWRLPITLAVVSYVAFLLITLPASLIIPTQAVPNLSLTGISGSIWAGSIRQVRYQNASFGTVNWDLNTWSLLIGKLNSQIDLRHQQLSAQGNISFSLANPQSGSIQNATVRMDSEFLSQFDLPLIAVEGNLLAAINQLSWKNGALTNADLQADWMDAKINSPVIANLGNVHLISTQDNDTLLSNIILQSGDLSGTADINIKNQTSYQTNAKLQANNANGKDLLDLLGKQSNGVYTLSHQGNLKNLLNQL